jgi:predicted MFS family arabinose efflux permease
MVSVAAIDFIASHQGAKAGGMAMYLTTYVGAGIAGAGLGSVLADRMGTPAVFFFGSLMVLWGLLLVWRWHSAPTAVGHAAHPSPPTTSLASAHPIPHRGASPAWSLLSHGGLWRLLLWMAFPMQMVQQGLLFYWTPLALASLGEHSSFTGMAMMGYFLAVLLLNQPLARQADRSGRHTQWVTMGLVLMGCSGVLVGWWHESWVLAVAVVLIGIAWAMSFPSQGAIMLKTTRQHCPGVEPAVALAGIRTFERLAGMLSPLIVAVSITQWGAGPTALGLGVCLLFCAGLLRLSHTQLASNHVSSHP